MYVDAEVKFSDVSSARLQNLMNSLAYLQSTYFAHGFLHTIMLQ